METKPGPKTTEFWTMIFTNVLGLVNVTGIWNYVPNGVSVYVMAIVSGLYAVARGLAKLNVKPDA